MKMRNLFQIAICLLVTLSFPTFAQTPRSTPTDGDWSKKEIMLSNSPEAEWVIRVGDIDNLGYGFEDNLDPFTGESTPSHGYPWDTPDDEPQGTDRIMIPTGYGYEKENCGGVDGYTSGTTRITNKVVPIRLSLKALKNKTITSATFQLFIDDFQSPSMGTRFKVWINDSLRFIELERILKGVDQTGPIGKLITLPLPASYLPMLRKDELTIRFDDSLSCIGDGYAIDFVKLLVNPKKFIRLTIPKVITLDASTQEPVSGAGVSLIGQENKTTDAQGLATFAQTNPGLHVFEVKAKGYKSMRVSKDVIYASDKPIELLLEKVDPIEFNGVRVEEGTNLVLKNIQFEQAQSLLLPAGREELDKVAELMNNNVLLEIELSGHTSNEGDRNANVLLSQRRAQACWMYLVEKGIDGERIKALGFGPDKPLVPNTTPENKAKNRRVELRITKF